MLIYQKNNIQVNLVLGYHIVPKKDKDCFNVDTKYPDIQEHHYHIYLKLCAKYGTNKRGMHRVNAEMLKILGKRNRHRTRHLPIQGKVYSRQ